jgi:hypothetical protein
MKQKDIALIAVIVIISGMLSFFLGRLVFSSQGGRDQKAQVVEPIVVEFNATPSKKYFNANAINPTEIIQIGENSNNVPFNAKP